MSYSIPEGSTLETSQECVRFLVVLETTKKMDSRREVPLKMDSWREVSLKMDSRREVSLKTDSRAVPAVVPLKMVKNCKTRIF